MNNERYKQLFSDASLWLKEVCRQLYVARVLFQPAFQALRNFELLGAASEQDISLAAEKVKALSNARAFHLGIAIENATKAKQVIEGKITVSDGRPKSLRTDHNILEHVRQCGAQLTEREVKFLERVSFQVSSLAKYPIAKDAQSQGKYTGIIVGSHPKEEPMVISIIAKVLAGTDLESAFRSSPLSSDKPM